MRSCFCFLRQMFVAAQLSLAVSSPWVLAEPLFVFWLDIVYNERWLVNLFKCSCYFSQCISKPSQPARSHSHPHAPAPTLPHGCHSSEVSEPELDAATWPEGSESPGSTWPLSQHGHSIIYVFPMLSSQWLLRKVFILLPDRCFCPMHVHASCLLLSVFFFFVPLL